MKNFNQYTAGEINSLITARTNITMLVLAVTAKLTDIEEPAYINDLDGIEFPPINLAGHDEILAALNFTDTNSDEGKWQAVVLMTYLNGGKIFYRKMDHSTWKAMIEFPGRNN